MPSVPSSLPFTHLHVASGYSLRYGASTPEALVAAAAAQGMEALALTDRDGLYGAVKFAITCGAAGVTPLLGVDLAVERSGLLAGLPAWADPPGFPSSSGLSGQVAPRRTPVRGGSSVDPRHPRVTVLALGADEGAGLPAAVGWGRLCRLVSATQLRGERGLPVSTAALIAWHSVAPDGDAGPDAGAGGSPGLPGAPAALLVLLGPDSEVGRAVLARRPDLALAVLRSWQRMLPAGSLAVEVVCHHAPEGRPASLGHAARMLTLARQAGVPAVLTNAVRYATPDGAATVDVLDSARRLVPLDVRHVDRVSAEGDLASPTRMARLAQEVADAAADDRGAAALLADTDRVARRCRLDPGADLGIGSVHLPELEILGLSSSADAELRRRCEARIPSRYPGAGGKRLGEVRQRLDEELAAVAHLGYAAYFITVGEVCRLIRDLNVRVAARGSGAGSLINYLLEISGVEPLRHGLLMERFLSPLRSQLPDVDLDVESARRTEIYERILERFGAERVSCVSMMDTYRVRHAVRDVGAALGLPPGEIDTIAKSFPHIRARDVRHALRELPELRAGGLTSARLDLLFDLVERLDGLPRHVALHPCGVLLSDVTLLDRTPVESSWLGFPMSQFDKTDVEHLGLLKLDILGIRMQSAMAYALQEVERVDGAGAGRAGNHPPDAPYLDAPTGRIDLDSVPLDDEATFELIRTTHTLGMFQIESPGQRELVGKFAPETFNDLIIDISLFRPGPVKSDMVTPFLRARQGWDQPEYLHPCLEPVLADTGGVVVFHEQVLGIVKALTGCTLAEADEIRRGLGSPEGQDEVEGWFRPRAEAKGYDSATVDRIWQVLKAFASFGFCKAHAAAFAVPTYHSAWLKAHHPAAFLAGVLTHDPGMYPKRLILDDARQLGISVLPLDVNRSGDTYAVERLDASVEPSSGTEPRPHPGPGLPDGRPYGIRLSLADVKGISDAEVAGILASRPYRSLADFWHRAGVSRPVVERLIMSGAFDELYGLSAPVPVRQRDRITRRDLLLQVAELDRWSRSVGRPRGRPPVAAGQRVRPVDARAIGPGPGQGAGPGPGRRSGRSGPASVRDGRGVARSPGEGHGLVGPLGEVRAAAARQSQAPRAVVPADQRHVQLTLDLGDAPDETRPSGLPEMTGAEQVRAELEVLGLDVSRHVLDFYVPMLDALGVSRSRDLHARRSRSDLLVAGVKVATQTPPVRSGRRVVFLTLDDATGPVDTTFFEDVQGPFAATVFHSWLLVVRGVLRRTGPRGISLRGTGAWELSALWDEWVEGGLSAVQAAMTIPTGWATAGERAVSEAAASHSSRPVPARLPVTEFQGGLIVTAEHAAAWDEAGEAATGLPTGDRAGGMGGGVNHVRRVLMHASGFRQSPYADITPAGDDPRDTRRQLAGHEAGGTSERRREPPRKLWHASPGSSGR
ncbi:MAG TPA: DNA polymerase III subunit alpha [Kineosporiaceae bacterium]